MSRPLLQACANHPDRDGTWLGEDTWLCHECRAKEMVVSGVLADHDPLLPMRRVIGQLMRSALDQLWYTTRDAAPRDATPEQLAEDYRGCCPICCAPCAALYEAGLMGYLDDWVKFWPDMLPSTSWWDERRRQVNRTWLERAWAGADELGCHR